MIKTNIKMRVTPEQLKKIAVILDKVFFTYEHKYIFLMDEWTQELSSHERYFEMYQCEEIDADLFIKTNGTCEETYLTKYASQPKDLESALKKIENLHIALNKKKEKNKNQALEITKLLEQKKDLQEINDTQNGYIRQLEIDIKQARNEVKFMIDAHKLHTETIKETYNFKLEQKDTIISYLESKLK